MSRIRKAYRYRMSSRWDDATDIVYAPTAGIAKAELFSNLTDCWSITWLEFLQRLRSFVRAPGSDIELPERHEMATTMPADDLHTITHAYGGTGPKTGHRDYFFTSADDPQLTRLVTLGAFTRGKILPCASYPGGSAYFTLTTLGNAIAAGEQRCYEPWVENRHAAKLASKRKALTPSPVPESLAVSE